MTVQHLRIVTRKSLLALWQAEFVKQALARCHANLSITLIPMSSTGDKLIDVPLTKIGGKGLFVKELEEALLRNEADIAVHSMKDVSSELPEALMIGAVLTRGDARDALCSKVWPSLSALKSGSKIGTSSLRRQAQLLHMRPDLTVLPLRGNVDTRLQKLTGGEFDAIILAAAGLERLGFQNTITEILPIDEMLPAAGQGAIGIECRKNDEKIKGLIAPLHDRNTAFCVSAERSVNKVLQGGCQAPIAAYARLLPNSVLHLKSVVADPLGLVVLQAEATDTITNACALGKRVAEMLLVQGAKPIIEAYRC